MVLLRTGMPTASVDRMRPWGGAKTRATGALLSRRTPNQGKANLKGRLRTAADLWHWGAGRSRTVMDGWVLSRACVLRIARVVTEGLRWVARSRVQRVSESRRNAVNAMCVTLPGAACETLRVLHCERAVWWISPGGERAATSRAPRGIRAGSGPLPREGPSSCPVPNAELPTSNLGSVPPPAPGETIE